MTRDEFWEHIRASRRVDPEEHAERLAKRLAKLPVGEILDFDRWWDVALNQSYRWDLWGAAYVIDGGCSDDGFDYFRGWLILQGRKVFEAAVKNPDTLAGVVDPDEGFIEYQGRPGWDAWFAKTGTEQNDAGYDALLAACEAHSPKRLVPRMGRRWDFDDDEQVRKRLPRLAKKYLDS
jgi:hypothetical protein